MLTEGARGVALFARPLRSLSDDEMRRLRSLADGAEWREVPSRRYDTADVAFWEPCLRAFFVRMMPGGHIPRHHDMFIPGTTHHLVLETNEACENWWVDHKERERMVHLKAGHRYEVSREPLHWAFNKGDTPRTHLLVEFK